MNPQPTITIGAIPSSRGTCVSAKRDGAAVGSPFLLNSTLRRTRAVYQLHTDQSVKAMKKNETRGQYHCPFAAIPSPTVRKTSVPCATQRNTGTAIRATKKLKRHGFSCW